MTGRQIAWLLRLAAWGRGGEQARRGSCGAIIGAEWRLHVAAPSPGKECPHGLFADGRLRLNVQAGQQLGRLLVAGGKPAPFPPVSGVSSVNYGGCGPILDYGTG